MRVSEKVSELTQHFLALEGKTVLYVERGQVFRVKVSNVKVGDDYECFEATATIIATQGLESDFKSWRFGAHSDHIHATADVVRETYLIQWSVYTAQEVMDEFLKILKDLPLNTTYQTDKEHYLNLVRNLGYNYGFEFVPKALMPKLGVPGTVAARMSIFLSDPMRRGGEDPAIERLLEIKGLQRVYTARLK